MKLQVKTAALQELLSKVKKGVGGNKLIAITTMIRLKLEGKTLTAYSTDATNFLKVSIGVSAEGEFDQVLNADSFISLLAKFTCENTEIECKENYVEVRGNGIYKMQIPVDENGNYIKWPEYGFQSDSEPIKVEISKIKRVLATNSKALARTMEEPCLTGYFFSDKVITSDSYVVVVNDLNVFGGKKLLMTESYLRLMVASEAEALTFQEEGGVLLSKCDGFELFGRVLGGASGKDYLGQFPEEPINRYIQEDFGAECKVSKSGLLEALARIQLFVGPYDKNKVTLTFSKTGIQIQNKAESGSELVKYAGVKEFKPFTCGIDVEILKTQVSAQNVEDVTLYYGHETAIKFTDGNMTQVVSLLED